MTDPNHIADARKRVGRPQIREVFMRNGAVISADRDDLPDYVHESVFELLEMAAPAVQGEPVAVMYEDGSLLSKADCGDNFEICCKVQTPLYTAPQPTEQQPDDSAAVRLDKQCREDVAAALGFIRGGNYAWSYLLQQIKDITSAERKQTAPDVAGLVEELEVLLVSGHLPRTWKERLSILLAAHRKQESEV